MTARTYLAPPRVTASRAERERARALVLRFGWNTTTYQILNPGFRLWFSASCEAVAGYVVCARRWVVGGAPVCALRDLAPVVAELEQSAARDGARVVYFGAEDRLDTLFERDPTHAAVLLGAQPAWDPRDWGAMIATHRSVRAQLNRARNKGVAVSVWPPERAQQNPELARVLREWLGTRGLPPLHFLIEPETLGDLADRCVVVAERNGAPVGFLVASPIPARRGWLTEQFVRGRRAPNGTAELMIDTAVQWMAAHGAEYVSMGLAPLSNRAGTCGGDSALVRFAFGWARAHGRRFYNFEGLDAFKAKFAPERWERVFAIANEPRFSLGSLYAIGAAFTDGHPIATVLRGAAQAVAQELRWARHRIGQPAPKS